MNKNIEIQYKNGIADTYIVRATDDLHLPSMGFKKEEEAELAIAIANVMKAHNKDKEIHRLDDTIVYVFKLLGIQNEWTE